MRKKDGFSQATFYANVSQLIFAKTKKQALDKAVTELNKDNIQLDQITLENVFLNVLQQLMEWNTEKLPLSKLA